MNLRGL